MTQTLETIKQEVKSLRPADRYDLWRDLSNEFDPPAVEDDDEDEASAAAAWDAEIDSRVKDIEEGKVQLISAEEADRRTDELFAKLGLQRPTVE